jgi:hypothetical protein
VGLYLLLDGLGQTIGLNLQIMTYSCEFQKCPHLVGFLESALVLDSSGNFSLEFLCARYNLLLDSLKSRGEFVATALTIRFYFSLLRGNEIFMNFDVSLDLKSRKMRLKISI